MHMVYIWFTYLEMLSFNRYRQKYPLKMVYDFKLPQIGYESNCFFIPFPKWALSNFKSVYNLKNKNYIVILF